MLFVRFDIEEILYNTYMRKIRLILVFYSLFVIAYGQNLIPNPGFDSLIDCPSQIGQLSFAPKWQACSSSFTNLTPTIYNICSKELGYDYPPHAGIYGFKSYQMPRSGGGYANLQVYYDSNEPVSNYIGTPLYDTLHKDKSYYIKFYVSPDHHFGWKECFIDAIGLAFTDSTYYKELGPYEVLPLEPAIEHRGTLITDTFGWTKISGCYIANGTEAFAIIGNFRDTIETTLVCEEGSVPPHREYYYLEDVLVRCFDPLPDTILLCQGESKMLNAGFLDASYLWNTGSTDSMILVDIAGKYIVSAYIDECVLVDSVEVINNSLIDKLYFDTLLCNGERLVLDAPIYGTYSWNTGSTDKDIIVNHEGNYTVSITNRCGNYEYNYNVNYEKCDCGIYVPNIFTPNGDGLNDYMNIKIYCDFEFEIQDFSIFDRWGNKIYYSKEKLSSQWDGSYKGKNVNPGVYVWMLRYNIVRNDKIINRIISGDITLIR